MLRSPLVARLARRAAHRRLRRMGGTQSVAWALRIPLVTLLVAAALVMVLRREDARAR
jgi:hypothetical protein